MERKPRTRNHGVTLRRPTPFVSTFHPLLRTGSLCITDLLLPDFLQALFVQALYGLCTTTRIAPRLSVLFALPGA